MEKDYSKMLDRAYVELPELLESSDRFQVPRAVVRQQGRRTYVMNFKEIAEELQRDPEHLMKFLLNETATRGNFDGT
ncbi:translation initiation factor IF-2 subunit beta, partial [Candidatus Bathyarchaeota archaeon]|nr:translation initiation factor IF-2 subunit beta [Candidatus Bathyarchaeota archaeon]